MQMKRFFCLLISAAMLLSGLSALAETVGAAAQAHTLEKKNVPLIPSPSVAPGFPTAIGFYPGRLLWITYMSFGR